MAVNFKPAASGLASVPVGAGEYVHPATFLMCGYLVHVAAKANVAKRPLFQPSRQTQQWPQSTN